MPKKTKNDQTPEEVLTPMQEKFAAEMVNPETKNATQAAIKAGASEKTARQTASRWLTKANILKVITKRRDEIAKVKEMESAEIIKGVSELAIMSPLDLMSNDGKFDLPAIKAAGLGRFIKEVTIIEIVGEKTHTTRTTIKGYDRLLAYRELAEYRGIKQLPRENEKKLQATVQAIRHYLDDHPTADREEVIRTFAVGRNLDVETVQEHLEMIQ